MPPCLSRFHNSIPISRCLKFARDPVDWAKKKLVNRKKPLLIIWIDGIIAAGKTTIGESCVDELNKLGYKAVFVEEPVEMWGKTLGQFYNNMEYYALRLQLLANASRTRVLCESVIKNWEADIIVMDRSVYCDWLFAYNLYKNNPNPNIMNQDDFDIYEKTWDNWKKVIEMFEINEMFFFVDTKPEDAMVRICQRKRACEQISNVSSEYARVLYETYSKLSSLVDESNAFEEIQGIIENMITPTTSDKKVTEFCGELIIASQFSDCDHRNGFLQKIKTITLNRIEDCEKQNGGVPLAYQQSLYDLHVKMLPVKCGLTPAFIDGRLAFHEDHSLVKKFVSDHIRAYNGFYDICAEEEATQKNESVQGDKRFDVSQCKDWNFISSFEPGLFKVDKNIISV